MVNFRGELGIPGRVVLTGGRMARPITEHPAITITTAVGVLAAIGLGLWAGYELRKRRFGQRPYNAYREIRKARRATRTITPRSEFSAKRDIFARAKRRGLESAPFALS